MWLFSDFMAGSPLFGSPLLGHGDKTYTGTCKHKRTSTQTLTQATASIYRPPTRTCSSTSAAGRCPRPPGVIIIIIIIIIIIMIIINDTVYIYIYMYMCIYIYIYIYIYIHNMYNCFFFFFFLLVLLLLRRRGRTDSEGRERAPRAVASLFSCGRHAQCTSYAASRALPCHTALRRSVPSSEARADKMHRERTYLDEFARVPHQQRQLNQG